MKKIFEHILAAVKGVLSVLGAVAAIVIPITAFLLFYTWIFGGDFELMNAVTPVLILIFYLLIVALLHRLGRQVNGDTRAIALVNGMFSIPLLFVLLIFSVDNGFFYPVILVCLVILFTALFLGSLSRIIRGVRASKDINSAMS